MGGPEHFSGGGGGTRAATRDSLHGGWDKQLLCHELTPPELTPHRVDHPSCNNGVPGQAGYGKQDRSYAKVSEQMLTTRPEKLLPVAQASPEVVQKLPKNCPPVVKQLLRDGIRKHNGQFRPGLANVWAILAQRGTILAKSAQFCEMLAKLSPNEWNWAARWPCVGQLWPTRGMCWASTPPTLLANHDVDPKESANMLAQARRSSTSELAEFGPNLGPRTFVRQLVANFRARRDRWGQGAREGRATGETSG